MGTTNEFERDLEDQAGLKRPGRVDLRVLQNTADAGDGNPGVQKCFRNYLHEGGMEKDLDLVGYGIKGTSVDINNAELQQLSNIGSSLISVNEWSQIANIGTTTISPAQWEYAGGADQPVKIADSPTFGGLTVNGNIIVTGNVDGKDVSGLCTTAEAITAIEANGVDFDATKTLGFVDDEVGVFIDRIYDEDNLVSDDEHGLATQQSIKKYVDDNVSSTIFVNGKAWCNVADQNYGEGVVFLDAISEELRFTCRVPSGADTTQNAYCKITYKSPDGNPQIDILRSQSAIAADTGGETQNWTNIANAETDTISCAVKNYIYTKTFTYPAANINSADILMGILKLNDSTSTTVYIYDVYWTFSKS